jgi:DHA1 family bicyclomycin/chloramphenicol resistance-like MFS transporter
MTSTPTDRRGGTLLVAVLIAQIAFGLGVMTICLPSMQDWSVQLGVPQATVQLTLSAYVLSFGVFQLLWGPLSDRHGRRPVLLAGLALMIAGLMLAALSRDANMLIAARFLQGVGGGAGIVAARAGMQDLFDGAQRTRVIGYSGMAMGITPPLATVIGGLLHAHVGWQANFVLMAALTAGLMLLAWRVLPATKPSPDAASPHDPWWRSTMNNYGRLLRERAFMPAAMSIAFTAAAWYAFLGAAPVVLGSYGVGPARLGLYVMLVPLAYIVGNFITTRLAHRLGGSALMLAGQCSSLAGIALMILLAFVGVDDPIAFTLPLALLGIGHGLFLPTAMVRTVGLVAGLAGAAAALTGVLQQLVGAASGYVVGFLSHEGPVNLGWVMLIATGLSLGAQLTARGQGHGREPARR